MAKTASEKKARRSVLPPSLSSSRRSPFTKATCTGSSRKPAGSASSVGSSGGVVRPS